MPQIQLPDKLLPLIQTPKRIKIIVGGRGGGKSVGVADILVMHASQGKKVGCGREFQNSIDDSVHSLISSEIDRMGAPGFDVQATKILHTSGGEFFYKGLARNPESLKSLHGVDYFWVEEAQTLSDKTLKLLTPSVRSTAGSDHQPEIWMTLNRGSSTDAVSQKFLKRFDDELWRTGYYEDDLILAIEINYDDNPWFPPELELERQDDFENLSRAKYDHIWGGKYADEVDNAIIQPEWFDACVDAHKKLGFESKGAEVVAHDPADSADPKALAHRHGSVILQAKQKTDGDVNTACDWATAYANAVKADEFVWDCDGMGISLKRQVADAFSGKKIKTTMFRGSSEPDNPSAIYEPLDNDVRKPKTNKETFKNKRAQYYWMLRDRVYKTYQAVARGVYMDPDQLISFSSDIEHIDLLRAEICRIPLKDNAQGTIQILSKPEMKRMDIPSPNLADSVMMTLNGGKAETKPVHIDFEGW